jgi:hypothetical protein
MGKINDRIVTARKASKSKAARAAELDAMYKIAYERELGPIEREIEARVLPMIVAHHEHAKKTCGHDKKFNPYHKSGKYSSCG